MLPGGSNQVINPGNAVAFSYPATRLSLPLVDYERGGTDIGDAGAGNNVQLWYLNVDSAGNFICTSDNGKQYNLLTVAGVLQASLAFDQQMQPVLCWVGSDGNAHLRYWTGTAFTVLDLPANTRRVLCTLDEKRSEFAATSDVLVTYMVGTELRMRIQRESYATEHVLATGVTGELVAFGMNTAWRMQWRITS